MDLPQPEAALPRLGRAAEVLRRRGREGLAEPFARTVPFRLGSPPRVSPGWPPARGIGAPRVPGSWPSRLSVRRLVEAVRENSQWRPSSGKSRRARVGRRRRSWCRCGSSGESAGRQQDVREEPREDRTCRRYITPRGLEASPQRLFRWHSNHGTTDVRVPDAEPKRERSDSQRAPYRILTCR